MRLWTNIFLPVKALLEFLLTFKDETIAHKLNDTHKSNAGLLLLGAFADWVGNRLSLYLMEAGTDKGQDPLEIRAFWQKERTATLIRIVSKLRFFFGGPEGDRTLDLTDANRTLSRTRHSTGPTLLAKQGFLPALLGPVYCAGFLGDANHWEEASE